MRESPRARQAKQKARITAYESLLAELAREEVTSAQIILPTPPRLGEIVIDADDLKKGYGDRLLFDDLTFKLPRGGIVGVM